MATRPPPRCPTCGQPVEISAENAVFPFCTAQCKLVDLGRWLDGSYRIPGAPVDPEEFGGRNAVREEED
ncbi:DNA gyrase inhibitor YacG [Chondromyces crocatus]|uniref:Uncharacterized protein n=1 Tax=Chondromyces crocatus TaxID=52 RepID=A0A0K1EN90_CHOCO|nr:DNA gyrase inhibitor YacG [Chondromyces crocatus]AKT42306.1 uncharacterized protein CMC5_065290 [Chondromyces crocatus]